MIKIDYKVEQMQNNQVIVTTRNGRMFLSYGVPVAFIRAKDGQVFLNNGIWDYSKTTGKYRNKFLGETLKETRQKIKDGAYKVINFKEDLV